MPIESLAQTNTSYENGPQVGPSQQIVYISFNVSAPFAATFQLAKIDKTGVVNWDESELTAYPGQGSYPDCHGIRFRNFQGGSNPTTVQVDGYFSDDPIPSGLISSNTTFSTNGSSTGTNMIGGYVNAGGTVLAGSGFTCSHTATGTYVLTFNPAFNSQFNLVAIPDNNNARFCNFIPNSPGFGTVFIYGAGGALNDNGFQFIAFLP